MDEDLTIASLAAKLNVRIEYAQGLVASGQIPSHQVHGETRVRQRDMLAYREAIHAVARAALVDLAQQARDLHLDSPPDGEASPGPPADSEDV